MAEIPVERTGGLPRWTWLLGLLLLLGLGWFIYEMFDDDRDDRVTTAANTTYNANNVNTTATPMNSNPAHTGAEAMNENNRITEIGMYASTQDKSSLVGKEAQFTNARVVRVVGPRTFTAASGDEEFYVMLDNNLPRQVGTQGDIDVGKTLNVTGSFERLQAAEIDNIANNRFRELTEQERAFLKNTQVYLLANQVGEVH